MTLTVRGTTPCASGTARRYCPRKRLRHRIVGFAQRVRGALTELSFEQRRKLDRLVVEEVRVAGCHIDIRLRIPRDQPPETTPPDPATRQAQEHCSSV
jgi:hypothetical protein